MEEYKRGLKGFKIAFICGMIPAIITFVITKQILLSLMFLFGIMWAVACNLTITME